MFCLSVLEKFFYKQTNTPTHTHTHSHKNMRNYDLSEKRIVCRNVTAKVSPAAAEEEEKNA